MDDISGVLFVFRNSDHEDDKDMVHLLQAIFHKFKEGEKIAS